MTDTASSAEFWGEDIDPTADAAAKLGADVEGVADEAPTCCLCG
jgi:hypothetical protein